MLSRAASSLYWIGRHIERADFTARLIEAALQFDLLPFTETQSDWTSAMQASGSAGLFDGDLATATREMVTHFLAFDQGNPSSIISCLEKARNDGRTVRTALTRECFETLNDAWLSFRPRARNARGGDLQPFLDWVKEVGRTFEGALHRTMLRNEPCWFLQLGLVLERADNTARLLDVKYHVLLPKGEQVGGALDQAQWTALLRSVSAVTAYRWVYREGLQPWLIADLMILREEMPRSLAACMEEANVLLAQLRRTSGRTGPADRQVRALQACLTDRTIEEIFQSGLHEFLAGFISDSNRLSLAVAEQFLF